MIWAVFLYLIDKSLISLVLDDLRLYFQLEEISVCYILVIRFVNLYLIFLYFSLLNFHQKLFRMIDLFVLILHFFLLVLYIQNYFLLIKFISFQFKSSFFDFFLLIFFNYSYFFFIIVIQYSLFLTRLRIKNDEKILYYHNHRVYDLIYYYKEFWCLVH